MFKRYSCGCITLEIGAIFIMIDACDKDYWPIITFDLIDNESRIGDLKTKEWKEVPVNEQLKYLQRIGENFWLGEKFRELKKILSD